MENGCEMSSYKHGMVMSIIKSQHLCLLESRYESELAQWESIASKADHMRSFSEIYTLEGQTDH